MAATASGSGEDSDKVFWVLGKEMGGQLELELELQLQLVHWGMAHIKIVPSLSRKEKVDPGQITLAAIRLCILHQPPIIKVADIQPPPPVPSSACPSVSPSEPS